MTLLFLDGLAGAGLFLLRLSLAAWLLCLSGAFDAAWVQVLLVAVAVCLCFGVQTRLVACLSTIAAFCAFTLNSAQSLAPAFYIVNAVALAMVGPGAFSADARFFGRRRVMLPNPDDTTE